MTISEFIKIRLKELNLTQLDLASALNITKQNLNNKLSRDNFSSKELFSITQFLKVDFVLLDKKHKYQITYPLDKE